MTLHARFTDAGQIDLPEGLAAELGFKPGDDLVVERDVTGALVIKSYDQVVREVRESFRRLRGGAAPGVVDELLAERATAAIRENDATEQWLARRL